MGNLGRRCLKHGGRGRKWEVRSSALCLFGFSGAGQVLHSRTLPQPVSNLMMHSEQKTVNDIFVLVPSKNDGLRIADIYSF